MLHGKDEGCCAPAKIARSKDSAINQSRKDFAKCSETSRGYQYYMFVWPARISSLNLGFNKARATFICCKKSSDCAASFSVAAA